MTKKTFFPIFIIQPKHRLKYRRIKVPEKPHTPEPPVITPVKAQVLCLHHLSVCTTSLSVCPLYLQHHLSSTNSLVLHQNHGTTNHNPGLAIKDSLLARQQLFTRKSRSIDNIPPTEAALMQHLKRAVYQGSHVWGQAFVSSPELPSPSQWGWTKNTEGQWEPLWTTLSEASQSCHELLKCGCIKGCKGLCKCYKAGLKCTALCKCSRYCNND